MTIINLLAPLFLIIALGAALQRGGMLSEVVVAGVNKLLYWVGLPAAVFHALVAAEAGAAGSGVLLMLMEGATLLNAGLSWLEALWWGVKRSARGTFTQAALRGNLSCIGLPLLLSIPGVPIGQAMLAFAPMLILHNALTVGVLVASQHGTGRGMWKPIITEIGQNPIILASVAGVAVNLAGWGPPVAVM
ncbi:MAG: hypothetical protein J6386_04675 [Candidatus Synoicihabitans palmerolidicus]|nr:hypothetical protein [Candidatus Synoicihabitans palmerolidicus]MCC5022127.1 hypothetical protein [Candidatus Synoicihabitans palmerolidicus]